MRFFQRICWLSQCLSLKDQLGLKISIATARHIPLSNRVLETVNDVTHRTGPKVRVDNLLFLHNGQGHPRRKAEFLSALKPVPELFFDDSPLEIQHAAGKINTAHVVAYGSRVVGAMSR